MAFRGERFHIDLSSDDDEIVAPSAPSAPSTVAPGFVKDIQERPASAIKPPPAPAKQPDSSGFPAHRKRHPVSKFKQQRDVISADATSKNRASVEEHPLTVGDSREQPSVRNDQLSNEAIDRRRIDHENRQRLSEMSDEAIAKERQELMEGLSPSLIERLLKRANIDDANMGSEFPSVAAASDATESIKPQKKVNFATASDTIIQTEKSVEPSVLDIDNAAPSSPTIAAHLNVPPPTTTKLETSTPPTLDPSDPNFFTDLHEKYYPSLAADPSKLAWMTDPASDPEPSPYDPDLETVHASALRFSFRGALLPPRTALELPTSLGLHHHGDAPLSAGYTVPELAHLARSAFPAQRCLAFQTLGRVLYRLGRGQFGDEDSDMAAGLWTCMELGRVIDTLEEAAAGAAHLSAKAYAVEALWLWRLGGGKRRKAV